MRAGRLDTATAVRWPRSVLVGILAFVPAQEHESHAHELEAFRIDVTETDLIGGKGIQVLHQFDSLVLQVFQQLVH